MKDVDKHMRLGEEITNTCHEFYKRSKTGLGPEIARFRENGDFYSDTGHASTYILRPGTSSPRLLSPSPSLSPLSWTIINIGTYYLPCPSVVPLLYSLYSIRNRGELLCFVLDHW